MENSIPKLLSDFHRLELNSPAHEAEIRNNIESGVTQFNCYDTFEKAGRLMDMEIRVVYNDNAKRHVITAIEALVMNDIEIPHGEVHGINLQDLEEKLKSPPIRHSDNQSNEDFLSVQNAYNLDINDKMKVLHDNEPDIFSRLMAKYIPGLGFEMQEEQRNQARKIYDENTISAAFSSYFDLKPVEIFNLLTDNDAWVQKSLFKKAEEGRNPEQADRFTTWIRPKFDDVRENGTCNMQLCNDFPLLDKLKSMHFAEVVEAGKLYAVYDELKMGGGVIATNLNKTGEPFVRIKADPKTKSIRIYSVNTGKLLSHNDYRKNPIKVVQTANGTVIISQKESSTTKPGGPDSHTTTHSNALQKKRATAAKITTSTEKEQMKVNNGSIAATDSQKNTTAGHETPKNQQHNHKQRQVHADKHSNKQGMK